MHVTQEAVTSSSESEDMDHYDTPKALNELVRRLGDRTVLVLPTENTDGEDGTSASQSVCPPLRQIPACPL